LLVVEKAVYQSALWPIKKSTFWGGKA